MRTQSNARLKAQASLSRKASSARVRRTSSLGSSANSGTSAPSSTNVKSEPVTRIRATRYICKGGTPSPRFWLKDGTVIIKIKAGDGSRAMLYKVNRSRLMKHCKYFAKRFAEDQGWTTWMVRGCFGRVPAFEVDVVTVEDFERLLELLENLEHIAYPMSEDVAVSLFRASSALSCDKILQPATHRLLERWNSENPPCRGDPARHLADALDMVKLARTYPLPGVLKRAFYEVLSNPDTYRRLEKCPDTIALDYSDIYRLFQAQKTLADEWRNFIVVAPHTDHKGHSKCPATAYDCNAQGVNAMCVCGTAVRGRTGTWRAQMVAFGLLDAGAADPIRYDFAAGCSVEIGASWCEGCLDERRRALEMKRVEWWNMLDGIIGM